MRAIEILQTQLDCSLAGVHRKRRDAVWRAVAGLAVGGKLWLTALGRSLPGQTSDKHRIKAADRLLGNKAVQCNISQFYQALAKRLLKRIHTPLVVIDWTSLGSTHYILSAQLCCDGRSLPLYNRVYPKTKLNNPQVQRQFLQDLATIVPTGSKPIVVTDAGFRCPWFDAVTALGWHFIGRIRNRTKVYFNHRWVMVRSLHRLAANRPRHLGLLQLPRTRPRTYRLVLSRQPKLKGRKRMTRRGSIGRNTMDSRCSTGAREPWVLVTSLPCSGKAIVRTYSLRMQVEQSFRDAKNHRHGWALHHARSQSVHRLEVLLLIASLAVVAVQTVGRAAVRCGLQRNFQANTISNRRVLSFFVLGRYVLRRQIPLPNSALLHSLNQAISLIATNSSLLATI